MGPHARPEASCDVEKPSPSPTSKIFRRRCLEHPREPRALSQASSCQIRVSHRPRRSRAVRHHDDDGRARCNPLPAGRSALPNGWLGDRGSLIGCYSWQVRAGDPHFRKAYNYSKAQLLWRRTGHWHCTTESVLYTVLAAAACELMGHVKAEHDSSAVHSGFATTMLRKVFCPLQHLEPPRNNNVGTCRWQAQGRMLLNVSSGLRGHIPHSPRTLDSSKRLTHLSQVSWQLRRLSNSDGRELRWP